MSWFTFKIVTKIKNPQHSDFEIIENFENYEEKEENKAENIETLDQKVK